MQWTLAIDLELHDCPSFRHLYRHSENDDRLQHFEDVVLLFRTAKSPRLAATKTYLRRLDASTVQA
jgi:hypothetical protein